MEAIKATIRERLRGSSVLSRALEKHPELQNDPVALLKLLEDQGLVDDIFASVESQLLSSQPPQFAEIAIEPKHKTAQEWAQPKFPVSSTLPSLAGSGIQLCLRINEGRAFLDYLDERDPQQDANALGRELTWHISFGRQRRRSRTVLATVDPQFHDMFFFELPPHLNSRVALQAHAVPLHLVLVCCGGRNSTEDPWDLGPTTLVCSHLLEWRHCLAVSGPMKVTAELQGVGRRHQLSVGVLHGELELRPSGCPTTTGGGTEGSGGLPSIAAQILAEEQHRSAVMRQAFEDLDRWWADYHELYLSRHIRLFAQTESRLFLPVTSFVTPLEGGRSLNGPHHALRWVTLISTEPGTTAENAEPCLHTFTTLWARGHGTLEEKTLLLCSLLLGFSLDAWCCFGTDARGQPHAWAMVRDRGDDSKAADVNCWDVRAGASISAGDARFLATYSSIDTIFNHHQLYVCHAGVAAQVSFRLSDTRFWLAVPLDGLALNELRLYPTTRNPPFADLRPQLWGLPADTEIIEEAIELRLAVAVRAHREAAKLPTRMDEHLSQLCHIVLADCEQEKAHHGVGNVQQQAQLFQSIVRRVCAPHEIFQAVPVQFNHLKLSLFWPALSDRASVRGLLALPASWAFAIRARVVPYPEDALAAWVLFAARGPQT